MPKVRCLGGYTLLSIWFGIEKWPVTQHSSFGLQVSNVILGSQSSIGNRTATATRMPSQIHVEGGRLDPGALAASRRRQRIPRSDNPVVPPHRAGTKERVE